LARVNVILKCYTMSSVHKLVQANWICFYTDHERRRRCKSTLTTNKQEAEPVCNEIQKIENKARARRLTPERPHKVNSQVVADVMESLGTPIERRTIREHFGGWISTKAASPGTLVRYQQIVRQFLSFLGPKANKDLFSLVAEDIERYRDCVAGHTCSDLGQCSELYENLVSSPQVALFSSMTSRNARCWSQDPKLHVDPGECNFYGTGLVNYDYPVAHQRRLGAG